jgi:hypothetical protein
MLPEFFFQGIVIQVNYLYLQENYRTIIQFLPKNSGYFKAFRAFSQLP